MNNKVNNGIEICQSNAIVESWFIFKYISVGIYFQLGIAGYINRFTISLLVLYLTLINLAQHKRVNKLEVEISITCPALLFSFIFIFVKRFSAVGRYLVVICQIIFFFFLDCSTCDFIMSMSL